MNELQIKESEEYKALYHKFKDLEEWNWLMKMKWLLILVLIAGVGFIYLFFPTQTKQRLITAKFHGEFFKLVQKLSFEGIVINRNFNDVFVFKKTDQSNTLVLVSDDGDSCTLMMPEKEFAIFKDDSDLEFIDRIKTSWSIKASQNESGDGIEASQQNKGTDQEKAIESVSESTNEPVSLQTD